MAAEAFIKLERIPFRKSVGKGATVAHLEMMLDATGTQYDYIEEDDEEQPSK